MSITAERKGVLMKDYATKPGDTGSPEVQVAILNGTHHQPDRTFQDPSQGQHIPGAALLKLVSDPTVPARLCQGPGRGALPYLDRAPGHPPLGVDPSTLASRSAWAILNMCDGGMGAALSLTGERGHGRIAGGCLDSGRTIESAWHDAEVRSTTPPGRTERGSRLPHGKIGPRPQSSNRPLAVLLMAEAQARHERRRCLKSIAKK